MDRLARGVRQPVLRRALTTLDVVTVAKASVKGTERLYASQDLSYISHQARISLGQIRNAKKAQGNRQETFGGHYFPALRGTRGRALEWGPLAPRIRH